MERMKSTMTLLATLVLVMVLLAALTLVPGCAGIQATPAYQAQIDFWADSSAEMNKRCQNGDMPACQANSANCTAALHKFKVASHGQTDPNAK